LRSTAGWIVNDKRVERIWRREGLKVPAKQSKQGRIWSADGSCIRLRAERPGSSGILCVRLISSLSDEPFAEDDGELGLGLEPLTRRPLPFLGRVVENEI
jgi:hypothetical protein